MRNLASWTIFLEAKNYSLWLSRIELRPSSLTASRLTPSMNDRTGYNTSTWCAKTRRRRYMDASGKLREKAKLFALNDNFSLAKDTHKLPLGIGHHQFASRRLLVTIRTPPEYLRHAHRDQSDYHKSPKVFLYFLGSLARNTSSKYNQCPSLKIA